MGQLFTPPVRAALILAMMGLAPACADADELRLESGSLPAPLLDNGQVNTVIEASAVEPIGDGRRFLLAHDKHPALFVVDTATGRLLGAPITSSRFPRPSKLGGPKWEGMARDSAGNYYIIGAHVGMTDEERASKSVLHRFRLKDGERPAIDDASVIRWDIAHSLVSSLKAQGLGASEVAQRKIEGLAIRERRKAEGLAARELVIGLREPSDRVRAFAADITSAPALDAEIELKPVFAFQAEPRQGIASQLTSLEYVPALGGFLVVTATEDQANTFHGNTLWFVPDGETSRAQKVAIFEVAMKAEGLAVLDVEQNGPRTAIKLLISYVVGPTMPPSPSRLRMRQ
jgi:hypothetical protein